MTTGDGSRDKFSNKLEYLLTSLSYAVGLGNVWRFPYMCYRNGGGSFLIPYLLSLLFLGFTFLFFESSIGQFTSLGPIQVWRLSPIFKGIGIMAFRVATLVALLCFILAIGYAMFIMGAFVGVYYNMIVAWSIYYMYASFTALPRVPWTHCDNSWNTINCLEHNSNLTRNNSMSPSQEYFYRQVLQMSNGIEEMGHLRPHLVLCLALSTVMVFLGLSLGTKSLGKISYFTALFPYIMITALLVNGVQLDGAMNGILEYIKPDFKRLASIEVWADAATQIFFSLSICMGGVITLASYNPYRNNTMRDSLIISMCNSMTSIYAGFAIFSVLGFMAKQIDKPFNEAADHGVGLAFVAYPAALAHLPLAPLWSFIFFVMLLTLGFGTQMTTVQTIVATLLDFWPSKLQSHKSAVLALVCTTMFLSALPMCTGAGIYILQLMDSYTVPYSAFIIGFFELFAIGWVYGVNRYMENIERMLTFKIWPHIYWKFMLKYGCAIVIVIILGLVISKLEPLHYNDYIYPSYAEYVGWSITLASVVMIPIFAIFELIQVWLGRKTLKDILKPDVDFINGIIPIDNHSYRLESAKISIPQLNYSFGMNEEQQENDCSYTSNILYIVQHRPDDSSIN